MSGEGSSPDDKTEQPTAKRLEDARKKGQVPSSKELNTSVMLLVGALGILFFGQAIMKDMMSIMSTTFTFTREQLYSDQAIIEMVGSTVTSMIILLLPILCLLFFAAFLGPLFISGFKLNVSSIAPKFSRLNPLSGMKRIFSSKGIVELLKALAKFCLLGVCATFIVYFQMDEIIEISNSEPASAIWHGFAIVVYSFMALAATTVLIAFVDVPYQVMEYMKSLRMTKQEVRDEFKEMEGNQDVKSRLRQMQRKFAQARMMHDVPTADVIITNPTHYAVALRYDDQAGGAPVVVAKGRDLIAQHIKKVALHHGVLIVSSPPLARSIYFTTEISDEIPAGLYVAVAKILAYVYQLKRFNAGNGVKPDDLPELEIPEELQHEG